MGWIGCSDPVPASKPPSHPQSPLAPLQTPQKADTTQIVPDSIWTEPYTYVEIQTRVGNLEVKLFNDTPKHRENFIKLVKTGFYNGTLFHRVVPGFMIQGGDPNSKNVNPSDDGKGGTNYTLPLEIVPGRFHKRGAVCAVQTPNAPNKSNGSQFYIVTGGQPIPPLVLEDQLEQVRIATGQNDFTFSKEAQKAYMKEGGAPWLDLQFTCFGEVTKGLDALDRLANLPTPRKLGQDIQDPALLDRPKSTKNAKMTVRVLGERNEVFRAPRASFAQAIAKPRRS